MEDNRREVLEKAFDEAEENNEVEEVTAQAEETQEEVPTETEQPTEDAESPVETAPTEDPPEKPVEATEVQSKPPVGWKPTAKVEWEKLPENVREEITNRERQMAVTMQEMAPARKTAGAVNQLQNQFSAVLQAHGAPDIVTATQGLLETAGILKFGSKEQKAQKLAQLVGEYEIDIATLDSALAGSLPQQPQEPQPQQFHDPRVDQMLAERNQQVQTEAQSIVQKFAAEHEFFEEVRYDMANFLDVARANNQYMSEEEAYQRACLANPEISQIMMKRQLDKATGDKQGQMNQKMNAASSVHGTQASGNTNDTEGMSRRDIIAAQFEQGGRV